MKSTRALTEQRESTSEQNQKSHVITVERSDIKLILQLQASHEKGDFTGDKTYAYLIVSQG